MSPHALPFSQQEQNYTSHINASNGNQVVELTSYDHGQLRSSLLKRAEKTPLRCAANDEEFDLICVGFGPANLALAIALHDSIDSQQPEEGLTKLTDEPPKVLFLERQHQFGWHKGMLLPGSKMQITFIKDLATLRNPRSEFTFLNYLHKMDRLATFTNLGTFLPQRVEYEDYMKWCAAAFDEVVDYSSEVIDIIPRLTSSGRAERTLSQFTVKVKDVESASIRSLTAKKVVLAVGGKPQLPKSIPSNHNKILHSAHYAVQIHDTLRDRFAPYTIAVVGCGQSAAEVFRDLHTRFPNSKTRLIVRGSSLRPSDDSPFVNEIFDPNRIDSFFGKPPDQRQALNEADRATNYGVVRINLLETLYEELYMQHFTTPDPQDWQHQILTNRMVINARDADDKLRLQLVNLDSTKEEHQRKEILDVDAVVFATGYSRDAHELLLKQVEPFRTGHHDQTQSWSVGRDYKVALDKRKVATGAGIWLSGCNEDTHGLSDTLLSVLATRGGELARSLFDN